MERDRRGEGKGGKKRKVKGGMRSGEKQWEEEEGEETDPIFNSEENMRNGRRVQGKCSFMSLLPPSTVKITKW